MESRASAPVAIAPAPGHPHGHHKREPLPAAGFRASGPPSRYPRPPPRSRHASVHLAHPPVPARLQWRRETGRQGLGSGDRGSRARAARPERGIPAKMTPVVVEPYSGWWCEVYDAPTEYAAINSVEFLQNPGTHHMTLSTVTLGGTRLEPGSSTATATATPPSWRTS